MFWNDPNMYGATLPYKEFNFLPFREFGNVPPQFTGHTFTPWQTPQRFIPPTIPPTYGMQPFFNDVRFQDPRMFYGQLPFNPIHQPLMNPFLQNQFTPFFQPHNVNLPLQNVYRPYTY